MRQADPGRHASRRSWLPLTLTGAVVLLVALACSPPGYDVCLRPASVRVGETSIVSATLDQAQPNVLVTFTSTDPTVASPQPEQMATDRVGRASSVLEAQRAGYTVIGVDVPGHVGRDSVTLFVVERDQEPVPPNPGDECESGVGYQR